MGARSIQAICTINETSMRQVWYLKLLLLFAIGMLGGAGALATIAPDRVYSAVFPQTGWEALSVQEKEILKPLASKWPTMEYVEQERWRALAGRFPQLSPTEQKRIERRMRRWSAATAVQRHAARIKYQAFKGKTAAEKQEVGAAWQIYSATRGAPARTLCCARSFM